MYHFESNVGIAMAFYTVPQSVMFTRQWILQHTVAGDTDKPT